jgi:hypothetical protein
MLRKVVESRLPDLARAHLIHSEHRIPKDPAVELWTNFIEATIQFAWWREQTGQGPGSNLVPNVPDPNQVLAEHQSSA